MDARDVILRPVITEQSMAAMDNRKYTFDVNVNADKTMVRRAVEEIFGVKVKKVNIMNVCGKLKRRGNYNPGRTNKRRKAIVTLTADSKEIKIFED